MKMKQRRCAHCFRNTLHQKNVFSGFKGAVLTMMTVGLFLPAWILFALRDLMRPSV